MENSIKKGTIIEVPEEVGEYGLIIDLTPVGNSYKAVIILDDCSVGISKFTIKNGGLSFSQFEVFDVFKASDFIDNHTVNNLN